MQSFTWERVADRYQELYGALQPTTRGLPDLRTSSLPPLRGDERENAVTARVEY